MLDFQVVLSRCQNDENVYYINQSFKQLDNIDNNSNKSEYARHGTTRTFNRKNDTIVGWFVNERAVKIKLLSEKKRSKK